MSIYYINDILYNEEQINQILLKLLKIIQFFFKIQLNLMIHMIVITV